MSAVPCIRSPAVAAVAALAALALGGLGACGADRLTSGKAAIVGGEPSGELGAVGALLRGDELETYCSGTLIADRLVLTAAHCLTRPSADERVVFAIGRRVAGARRVPVLDRVPHEDFVEQPPPPGLAGYDDIGLALLSWAPAAPSLELAQLVAPAEASELVVAGRGVLVAGYGLSVVGDGDSLGERRRATTTVEEVAPTELRLRGAPDKPQKCAGDSGGPTFGDLDPGEGLELRLIGVASRAGDGCVGGSAETRVDAYRGWIAERAARLGCDLTRGACEPPRLPAPPRLEPIAIADEGQPRDSGCAVGPLARIPPSGLLAWLALLVALRRRRR